MITIDQMLVNLGESIGPVETLVKAFAFVIGTLFIFKGLYQLKVYGDLRTMSSSQTGVKEPLSYLFIGALFYYFPTMIEMMMLTVFGQESPLDYSGSLNGSTIAEFANVVLRLMQLIGWISFIRGWMILAKSSAQGAGGQGIKFSKGITHVIGGLLAINIVGTTNIIGSTLGLGELL